MYENGLAKWKNDKREKDSILDAWTGFEERSRHKFSLLP
mgnify:CR=1 FL=1